jgi:hypothetical protein
MHFNVMREDFHDNKWVRITMRTETFVPAVLFFGLLIAHAAEPTGTLTLACEGTRTVTNYFGNHTILKEGPEPISMGIILDFAARTVAGFDLWDGKVVITYLDEWKIGLGPKEENPDVYMSGSMDRITGDANLTVITDASGLYKTRAGNDYDYSMKCKPTQRMF